MSLTVEDHYPKTSITVFEQLLDEANDAAIKDNEIGFVERLRERYAKFSRDTYLSTRQLEWLMDIAGWDDGRH